MSKVYRYCQRQVIKNSKWRRGDGVGTWSQDHQKTLNHPGLIRSNPASLLLTQWFNAIGGVGIRLEPRVTSLYELS